MTLHRGSDVPVELWNAVGRNIAPGLTSRPSDGLVEVPLDRFLAGRNWLGRTLVTFACETTFDAAMLDVLRRADAERDEITRALGGELTPLSADTLAQLLASGRFVRELRPFQLRDLAHILSLSHGANFSVPGAGKTAVAYATYETERDRHDLNRLLVVAPLSAFDSWLEEASECLSPMPRLGRFDDRLPRRAEVVLVNYQRLSARYNEIASWVAEERCHVILDEAHRMKRGHAGEWGSACLKLAHLAARRDILTGTPAPQHPMDLSALFDFLWPHQATRILPAASLQRDPSPNAMFELSRRLTPLFVRTNKDELGLDPPTLRVELVEMNPLQAEVYESLRSRMRSAMRRVSARDRALLGDLGGVVMYLLEAATNPALLASAVGGAPLRTTWPPEPIPPDSTLAELIRTYARHETPRKFEKLVALVAANAQQQRKTLIWSNFLGNLRELHERVLARYEPALIHGGVPSGGSLEGVTRETELRRFREDVRCMVLLANPAAMSEGVSLHHACHDAIYLDRTFNAGQYLQSLDRIHRLGLAPGTETRITFLVSATTVDETVDARVRVKAERLGEMLSDPNLVTMALPDEEAYGTWIDADDVDALLAHLGSADG